MPHKICSHLIKQKSATDTFRGARELYYNVEKISRSQGIQLSVTVVCFESRLCLKPVLQLFEAIVPHNLPWPHFLAS